MSDRNGFEWRDEFYPWAVSDVGKDLMLIDRIAQMPIATFMELVADAEDSERAPVLLALIATSIRAQRPEWSVDRIYRTVMDLSLSEDVSFVYAEQEDESPLAETSRPSSGPGRSPSIGSSQQSTPPENGTSETYYATPV